MSWLIIAGAAYLVVSTVILLAMCRAAARGDAHRDLLADHPQPDPNPSDGPRPTPATRPFDRAS